VLEEVERFTGDGRATLRLDLPAPSAPRSRARSPPLSTAAQARCAGWSAALRKSWPRYLAFQDHLVARVAEIVRRGKAEGTLAPDVDPEADARVVIAGAPVVVQMKLGGRPAAEVERFIVTLVQATLGRLTR
jgi:hypothetical protein